MKNFNAYACYLVFCFLSAFVIGCGGRVENKAHAEPIPSIPCGEFGDCSRFAPCISGGTIECTPTGCVAFVPLDDPGAVDLDCINAKTPTPCGTQEKRLRDLDGDGYGDSDNFIWSDVCAPWEKGFVNWFEETDDCDDTNPQVHPGAVEILGNGIDEDCDGKAMQCLSGQTASCACQGGTSGTQQCAPDGMSYGPCACETEQEAVLNLEPGEMPSSQIIVQTQKFWVFSTYTYTTGSNGTSPIIKTACISQDDPDGDMADVDAFMLATLTIGDSVEMSKTKVNGNIACIAFETDQVVFPLGSSGELHLAAHEVIPVSSQAANGAWHGVPRSGHTPRFRLVSVTTKGGQKIEIPSHVTPKMVIRKSQPIVTSLGLASTKLVNGDMDLYKFQVASDPAGPVSVKSFSIPVQKKSAVSVSQFRLRKGNSDLPVSAYLAEVLDFDNFTKYGSIESGMKNVSIAIQLTSEEVINGSGVVFTLHGTVAGASTGASIDIGLGYGGPLSEGSLTSWLVKMKPTDIWLVLYTPELTNGVLGKQFHLVRSFRSSSQTL